MTEEYRAVPADGGSAEIVRLFFEQNLAQLHSASVPLSEWRETLGAAEPPPHGVEIRDILAGIIGAESLYFFDRKDGIFAG